MTEFEIQNGGGIKIKDYDDGISIFWNNRIIWWKSFAFSFDNSIDHSHQIVNRIKLFSFFSSIRKTHGTFQN